MKHSLSDLPLDVWREVVVYLPLDAAARLRATSTTFNDLILHSFPQMTRIFLLFQSKHSVIRVLCGHLGTVVFTSTYARACREDHLVLDLQEGASSDKLNSLATILKKRLLPCKPISNNKPRQDSLNLTNGLLLCKNDVQRPKSFTVQAETPRAGPTNITTVFENLMDLFHDLSFVLINCELKDPSGDFATVVESSLQRNRITTTKLSFMVVPKKTQVSLPWNEMRNLKRFEVATLKEKPSVHLDLKDEDLLNWDFDQVELNALSRVTPQGLHRLMDQFLNSNRKRTISLVVGERQPIAEVTAGFQKMDAVYPWMGFARGGMQVEVRCLPGEATFLTMQAYPQNEINFLLA